MGAAMTRRMLIYFAVTGTVVAIAVVALSTQSVARRNGTSTAAADPIPTAILASQGQMITAIPDGSAPSTLLSQSAAVSTALAQSPAGSQVLEVELATVTSVEPATVADSSGLGTCNYCYVIAVDPKGGATPVGGALSVKGGSTPRPLGGYNYDVHFVDATTGVWLTASLGYDPSLGPFPPIDGVTAYPPGPQSPSA